MKDTKGSGHSLRYGDAPKMRYCSDTGKPYWTEQQSARLSTSNAKMNAIWRTWEMVPDIIKALESVDK